VHEIHHVLESHETRTEPLGSVNFVGVLLQIGLLDLVFSLDSVITAVGMVSRDKLWVMISAIVLAILVMVVYASRVGEFVHRHPTLKMLALSFLILIGVMLIAEGLGTHVNKGYIYFAMAFAVIVEFLNMRLRKVQAAVT
jgi:predicted tellurium resistance membrane protein TerC